MSLEQELRDTLRRAAADVGPAHPEASMREVGMRALAHRRSRRRVTVLSAGLAVLVIAVGIPTGMSLVESAGNEAAAPVSTAEATAEPTRSRLPSQMCSTGRLAAPSPATPSSWRRCVRFRGPCRSMPAAWFTPER